MSVFDLGQVSARRRALRPMRAAGISPYARTRYPTMASAAQPGPAAAPAAAAPADPWGNVAANPGQQQSYGTLANTQIAEQLGPAGHARAMAAVMQRARQTADAQRARTMTLGKLVGLDPAQYGSAILQSDLGAQAGEADAVNSAEYGQILNDQNYARDLLSSRLNDEQQQAQEYQRFLHEKNLRAKKKKGLGGWLGDLAGVATGAFFGGLGKSQGQGD